MSIVKAFKFPASVHWRGGRLTEATARDKRTLEIATPPEFKGGMPGVWSPEDLLVAATASCFALTLAAVAERAEVPVGEIDVDGVGHVEPGQDGRFRFTVIELSVEVETADPHAVERLIADTERRCIVTLALDVPIHVELVTTAPAGAAVGS